MIKRDVMERSQARNLKERIQKLVTKKSPLRTFSAGYSQAQFFSVFSRQ